MAIPGEQFIAPLDFQKNKAWACFPGLITSLVYLYTKLYAYSVIRIAAVGLLGLSRFDLLSKQPDVKETVGASAAGPICSASVH